MPIGPVPNQAYHHNDHHAQPVYLSKATRKLFVFFPKSIVMAAVTFLWVCFAGLAAVILFPLLFVCEAIKNRRSTLLVPSPRQACLPVVGFSAAEFPGISECSICLECYGEGDECRIIPACKHLFHSICVDRWIQRRPTCPVCRVGLKPYTCIC